ncbi:MAG: hypothetical protein AAFQ02_12490 [Bacteroidota bacterium]
MKKVLHIVGSLNQTKQLYKVSQQLPDFDHYFCQFFGSGAIVKWISESGIVDNTILGTNSTFRQAQKEFLDSVGAKYDYRASTLGNMYDLVFMCSDIMVPREIDHVLKVWVQEGMTDPLSFTARMVKRLGLPYWLSGDTSLNGSSNRCDLYCVASEGYGRQIVTLGTDEEKIHVTGIPNFDNCAEFLNNDFPHQGYVLICTSDMREVNKKDDRRGFLQNCKRIAAGRPMIVKLHPNEIVERATREIRDELGPEVQIYTEGNTDHMIANCVELITQYSTVVYIGMALGIPVHSYFDLAELQSKLPIQNGGTSASEIARLARQLITRRDTPPPIDPRSSLPNIGSYA